MPERPAPVRITDYAEPHFTPEIRELRESVGAMAADLRLEASAVLTQASDETGLDDFGPPSFCVRLELLLYAMREEAGLDAFGVLTNHSLVVQLLRNRLLVQDVLKRHPEIHDEVIDRPVVICGLPRTGTTHLHHLISADPKLRSLPYWESLEPLVPDGAPDDRRERTQLALGTIDAVMPLFKRMHEMTVDHVHEEIQLLAIDFSSMLFETMGLLPTWRDHYLAHDQTPHYEYLRDVLKILQWVRGPKRWVLKSPQHLEQFVPLRHVFPDATFVVTHRDPVAVIASMVTMLAYTARMSARRPDPLAHGAYWMPRLERMLQACAQDRDTLPEAQAIDVHFDEFMGDDVGMVERIYDVAGLTFDGETKAAMDAFMAEHPRGRHGGLIYDLADFGLDAGECREAFAFYSERFAVTSEVT